MEQPNANQQELIYKLQMYEQQIQNIHQQIQAVENARVDMDDLIKGITELKGKKDSEILAQIGKGIFVKAKIISEELIVDVGNKNLVKKDIDGTNEIIQGQLEKLEVAKVELEKTLEQINKEMTGLVEKFRESQ
ncbi:prefoldin subunit alpha [archaeon]|nr:prefoldin subunit alpha [archaeon]MBT4373135.1 prefoldin subunit alpha [archaeon]MBT4531480.1 prefoldin subunit alpha [archaeon]MBT7001342.1 prefoldin subunit alpha [archaeon]MBT7282172.1 prefoldin subunit alpha [archaeon]